MIYIGTVYPFNFNRLILFVCLQIKLFTIQVLLFLFVCSAVSVYNNLRSGRIHQCEQIGAGSPRHLNIFLTCLLLLYIIHIKTCYVLFLLLSV